ncbi:MAG: VOC family protein [Pricia sp.]
MDFKNVYAGIMTADITTAAKWYTNLFDRTSDYHPMDNLHEWDLPNGGVLQLVQDKDRAGSSSITVLVDDIETVKKGLDKKDITVEQQSTSEVAKTATILDPENNRITFAQNLQGRQ